MARGGFAGPVGAALLAALAQWAMTAGAAAQEPARRAMPLRIDCADAPLYVEGGLNLLRDPNRPGLVLVARLPHARGGGDYRLACSTEAVPGAAADGGYDFVCIARQDGRAGGGAEGRVRGSVPAGEGLDHPEVRAAIAAAACPAARLALARLRAGGG